MTTADKLRLHAQPKLTHGKMVLAFTGWMDGGDVSTGTVKRLINHLDAEPIAEIEPDIFYIYNFPGAMEVTAMFRPHIRIEDGRVEAYEPPSNLFYCHEPKNLVFFVGKEPNLNWREFGDCIFTLARQVGVTTILFVGSFGGSVPHTREPRLYATVSDPKLLPVMQRYGIRPSNYEGPGSFTAYLLTQAERCGIEMTSLVAEIPGYLQGTNPLSIEAVTRRLAVILDLSIDLSELRTVSNEWESQVSAAVEKDPDLAKQISELEQRYDDELIASVPDDDEDEDGEP